jgi:hypothetical protein
MDMALTGPSLRHSFDIYGFDGKTTTPVSCLPPIDIRASLRAG